VNLIGRSVPLVGISSFGTKYPDGFHDMSNRKHSPRIGDFFLQNNADAKKILMFGFFVRN
jgi:hypothetical protein